mgnify:FL=1
MKYIKNTLYFLFGLLMFGVFLIDRVIQVPLWWLKSENFDAFMSGKKVKTHFGSFEEINYRKASFYRITTTVFFIGVFLFFRFLWNLVF